MRMLMLTFVGLGLVLTACQTPQEPGGRQNRTPAATFTASALQGAAPLNVEFDASASSDPDGVIAAVKWAFGDGEAASGMRASHSFEVPGRFTVQLTVTDNRGATATAEQVITVTDRGGNLPPSAAFTTSATEGTAPLTVGFDASASTDADGAITAYAWDFGDGEGASGVVTTHAFGVGTFTVVLTVTDDGGLTATHSATIEVEAEGATGADEEARVTSSVHALAEAAPFLPDTLLASAVDIALTATQLSGSASLVVSGTVTQTGEQTYSYDPAPSDRLRGVLLDGRQFDITFAVLQGNFGADGARFMSDEHRADAQVIGNVAAGNLDVRLRSEKLNGSQARAVQGALTDSSGVSWTLDVLVEGTYSSDADVGSFRLESNDLVQGMLHATELGVSVTLGKRYIYKMLNGVENVRHEVDRNWTWSGSAYRLQFEVFVAFNEAQPVDTDQWVIQGGLARDGTLIAPLQAAEDATGLDIWLALGAERVALFRFNYL